MSISRSISCSSLQSGSMAERMACNLANAPTRPISHSLFGILGVSSGNSWEGEAGFRERNTFQNV